uniref:Uncharacterized protein n=1 Tax=Panagrolaimus davidi TaxID=227884 RepID=A0A914QMQ3_9BILA
MTSNVTDVHPGQKFHFFITSLFSQHFFYNYEFYEKKPTNLQLENVKVKWWYPDVLFGYHETVTIFELFKRRMIYGYKRYREKLLSIIAILPSNFNFIEKNPEISSAYGDRIIILTPHLAKLYYIISKVITDKTYDFIDEKNFVIISLSKKFIVGEMYHVKNRELELMQRIEHNCDGMDYNIKIGEILKMFDKKENITTIFVDENEVDIEKISIGKNKILDHRKTDEEMMLEGAIFKAKNDYDEKYFVITDHTKRLPKLNIVYKLLNAAQYKPMSDAIGIDLGTTRSAAAIHSKPTKNAEVDVVPVPDRHSQSTLTYSWVAFDQEHPICGNVVFERYVSKQKYTVFDAKRIIGRKIEEINPKDKNWPFKVVDENGIVKIFVERNDKPGQPLLPEEISAILLNYVKQNVETFTQKPIKQAVITVPAGFTQRQKSATQKATYLANIEVLHFLPEPTAAALYYCSIAEKKPNDDDNIFVFDLGGGTTDISIFTVKDNSLVERCQHGNMNLGGNNFNKVLKEYFEKDLLSKNYNVQERKKQYWLELKSADVKEALTENEEASLFVEEKDIEQFDIEITRDDFEELSKDLITELKQCIYEALEKANLKPEDIALVIKVGGSCIMPMIIQLLNEIFPKKQQDADPSLAVARGAALYAASILPQKDDTFIKNYWPL